MKVVSYYNVVPAINKSQEKFDILTKFVQGVNACGDTGVVHRGDNLIDCDVAVIQGWQHQTGKSSKHLQLRQRIIDYQKSKNKDVCVADSNLFLYATENNKPYHYLRYSLNGVFPNTGQYFDDNPCKHRWEQISKDLNISIESNKNNGKNILICLQRNNGWSMGKLSVVDWTIDTINQIRKNSDRPIVIRLHPGDKKAVSTYIPELQKKISKFARISLSTNNSIDQDLNNAWAVVNHNSSSIVGPIIKGYHAFVTDPNRSQCREVSHDNFKFIEYPKIFDRQKWVERLSMFHWKFSELENGDAWNHIKNYVFQ